MRTRMKVISMVVCFFAVCLSVQSGEKNQQQSQRSRHELSEVRKEIRNFFQTWLIQRDTNKAMQYFSSAAFKNTAMLQESFDSNSQMIDRKSENGIKKLIIKFLEAGISGFYPKNLEEAIGSDNLGDLRKQLGCKVLNTNDEFLLIWLLPKEIPEDDETFIRLKKQLPSTGFYVSFAFVRGGLCSFCWIKEKGKWRIFHAEVRGM